MHYAKRGGGPAHEAIFAAHLLGGAPQGVSPHPFPVWLRKRPLHCRILQIDRVPCHSDTPKMLCITACPAPLRKHRQNKEHNGKTTWSCIDKAALARSLWYGKEGVQADGSWRALKGLSGIGPVQEYPTL